MPRSLQAPSAPRLPDPPAQYDYQYMRELIGAMETEISRLRQPIARQFTVMNRDETALSLDVSTATAAEVRAFLGELAAAFINSNKLGGTA